MSSQYIIYRDGVQVAIVPAGTTTFDDPDLMPGTYTYTIVAFQGSSVSAQSNPVVVTVPSDGIPLALPPGVRDLDVILRPVITYNGLTIGGKDLDANGVGWVYSAVDGWDFAPLRIAPAPRGQHHGVFTGPAFLSGRELVVSGHFAASDPTALLNAREQLHAAMSAYSDTSPFVVGETPPKMVMARANVGSKDRFLQGPIIEFELHLLCPDPLKYDPDATNLATGQPANVPGSGLAWPAAWPLNWGAASSGGVIQATNNGNAATSPRLTITGPCVNPAVENRTAGQRLALTITLLQGDTLVIDMDTKAVVLNGNAARRGVVTSSPTQWWTLAPGGNEIRFTTADGSDTGARLMVSYRSAWN